MYHVENMRPRTANICDQCGDSLIQRSDDQIEVIKKRLSIYHQQTEPLIGFYRAQRKLSSIDARKTADAVGHALVESLR
jgi:adenylate kinase